MQFSARFGFDIAPETAALANSIKDEYKHLPKERVYEEFKKLTQKGIEPGRALDYLYKTGWSENFPHIHNLQQVKQEKEWHPEGDVDEHTRQVMNEAAQIAAEKNLSPEEKEVLVFAALCHDFAKPATTKVLTKKGIPRITSHGHEEAGGPMTRHFLQQIGAPKNIIEKVVPLVENHLNHIHMKNSTKQDSFVKNLAERLHPASIKELHNLINADHQGRRTNEQINAGENITPPQEAQEMANKAQKHGVYESKHPGFIQGRDILSQYPWMQPGKQLGDILREHRNYVLNDNKLTTQEDINQWLDDKMKQTTGLIKGGDLLAKGYSGPIIKEKLNQAWEMQKQGLTKEQILEKLTL
jgi:tRNA nucleotidyltransferase (CCA-adding enzyme)